MKGRQRAGSPRSLSVSFQHMCTQLPTPVECTAHCTCISACTYISAHMCAEESGLKASLAKWRQLAVASLGLTRARLAPNGAQLSATAVAGVCGPSDAVDAESKAPCGAWSLYIRLYR